MVGANIRARRKRTPSHRVSANVVQKSRFLSSGQVHIFRVQKCGLSRGQKNVSFVSRLPKVAQMVSAQGRDGSEGPHLGKDGRRIHH